jgi:hypothetical protein
MDEDFHKIDVNEKIVRVCNHSDKKIKPFKSQSYEILKKECLKNGRLFEDPLFPVADSSMFYTQPVPNGAKWKRPKEICSSPKFMVNEADAADLDQGYLGNCKKKNSLKT